MLFFLPDNGENQTKQDLHRKFNAFIRAIFIFRRRLPIFVVCFFTEICCTWGPISKEASAEQEKNKTKTNNKVLTKIY